MKSESSNIGLVAVTGGIGSGKSVVCRVLRAMGYEVYDCDSEAKSLMDSNEEIKRRIVEEISTDCVIDGIIDRKRLGEIVFDDCFALARLNFIVHSAVREDLLRWRDTMLLTAEVKQPLFVETAILYESRLDREVDAVWVVEAPEELRIERVMARNGLTADEVKKRISAQMRRVLCQIHPNTHVIYNDDFKPVVPQILKLLNECQTIHC